ncbi:hypothetical protein [Vibrio sp. TRT 17S01]|uniref:hypothetical protein n=1 Tax=Vibrio sp. TRT 17S01 TaxID=3418505 RepID=UPI003CE879F3
MKNIVRMVLTKYFNGSYTQMAELFGVSAQAVRKWENQAFFPADTGRMEQAHALTGIERKKLNPRAHQTSTDFKYRLQKYRKAA